MGPAPITCDPNYEPYTKKPINRLKIVHQNIKSPLLKVMLLSDGRLLIQLHNDYYIYNKDNPKEIDIKINKDAQFHSIIAEIDYRLIIENSGKLIQLEDKIYKFYNGLKDIFPSPALKLSNGLIIITNGKEYANQFINFCKLDKNEKKLIKEYEIKTKFHHLQNILEINPHMIMIYGSELINGEKSWLEFYDNKNKILATKILLDENCLEKYPIMFGKDLLLLGGKNKFDMYNINKGYTIQTIKTNDKYRMYRFLIINEHCFLGGDSAGNIYVFKEKKGNITTRKTFRAHYKLIICLDRYNDNIIVTASQDDVKFWDISEYI